MSRAHHTGTQASQRMLRVGELIRHTLAELLARGDFNDPILESHPVTIPQVRMSPDLKLATIFVVPLGGADCGAVIAALDGHKKALRAAVARRVNLRFAPDIRFKADSGFEASRKIDDLLRRPEVMRDLQPHDGGDAVDAAQSEPKNEPKD